MKKLLLIIAGCLGGLGLCVVPLLVGAADNKVMRADRLGTITNGGPITNISQLWSNDAWATNDAWIAYGPPHHLDLDKFHTCEDLVLLLKAYMKHRGEMTVYENTEEYRILNAYCK